MRVRAKSLSDVRLLAAPWIVALQSSLSVVFSRQGYWNGLPCPTPGDLPHPGIEPMSLMFPALGSGFFSPSATWEAPWVVALPGFKYKAHFWALYLFHPTIQSTQHSGSDHSSTWYLICLSLSFILCNIEAMVLTA